MLIGPYQFTQPLVLSPMAGITDRPFRLICRRLGADLAVSEMVTSDPSLWKTAKSRLRMDHRDEPAPRSVQIAGADPLRMAEAARYNIDNGAEIIDINMGCPAKKVCNVLAGSALLKDEVLVGNILEAVVNAVNAPVTLKTRTGWDHALKNGLKIAHIAEQSGIQSLAIHGRTRADAYNGDAEYDTIREIKSRAGIPVLANGDIDSPEKAQAILDITGTDGLLIGRAAQGNPWIFREIRHYLHTGEIHTPPSPKEICAVMLMHLESLYNFYGDYMGVRIARKHIGWYLQKHFPTRLHEMKHLYKLADAAEQFAAIKRFLNNTFETMPAITLSDAAKQAA
jgi:tRNA-dihydrouridine synthase B